MKQVTKDKVLQVLDSNHRTAREISDLSGLSYATALRCLQSLSEEGLAVKKELLHEDMLQSGDRGRKPSFWMKS